MAKISKDALDPELHWERTLDRLSAMPIEELIALVREHADAFQERDQGLAEPASREQNLELAALACVLSERDPSTRDAVEQWKTGVKNKPSGPLIDVLSQCAGSLKPNR